MLIKNKRVVWTPAVAEMAEQPYRPARPRRVESVVTKECRYVTTDTWTPPDLQALLLELVNAQQTDPDINGLGAPSNLTYDTQYLCEYVTRTTIIPAVPEIPFRAAVQGRPASAVEEFYLGWNAGAELIENFSGDGYFEFSVSAAVVGAVVGLNTNNAGTDYFEISHGFKCARGKYKVIEVGAEVHSGGGYTSTTAFRIQRNGTQVRYFVDGALVYTSALPSASAVVLDCSLYSGGDSILSARAGTTADAIFTPGVNFGSSSNSMRGVTGVATDLPFSESANSLNPLVGSAAGTRTVAYCYSAATLPAILGQARDSALPPGACESAGVLPAITWEILGRGFSIEEARLRDLYGANYRQSSGSMLPMRGAAHGGGGSVQAFALSAAELAPLYGYATLKTIRTGHIEGDIHLMGGMSSDRTYGSVAGFLYPLLGGGADRVYLQPAKMLPAGEFVAFTGAVMSAELSDLELLVETTVLTPTAVEAVAPLPEFSAFTGAVAGGTVRWSVQTSVTVEVLVSADMVMPAPLFDGAAVVGVVGRADLLPSRAGEWFSVEAYTGAIAIGSATFDAYVGGVLGIRGGFAGSCPRVTATAAGTLGILARAQLVSPTLERPQNAIALLSLPAFEFLALANLITVDPVAADYEAYVVNLGHEPTTRWQEKPIDEVTRYTNFPFSHIVRYGDSYYGVGLTGLYKLGGDKDDGADISWAARTALTDFGESRMKNLSSAYIGGRLGPQTALTLHVGEHDTSAYTYETPRGVAAQNHRQKFGKGNRARYYALSLSGTGVAEIDDIGLDVHTATRRI
jgi:hypothetical protein